MTTTTHAHNAIILFRVQRRSEIERKKKKYQNSSSIMCIHSAAAAAVSNSVSIIIIKIIYTVCGGGGGRAYILSWRYYILLYSSRNPFVCISLQRKPPRRAVACPSSDCHVLLYYCIISSRPLVDEGRLQKKKTKRNTFYTLQASCGGSSRIKYNNVRFMGKLCETNRKPSARRTRQ